MGLFNKIQMEQINAAAKKSQQIAEPKKSVMSKSVNTELNQISENVKEYFKDSKAELITTPEQLHDYVTKMIESGIGGIDTETTGLNRLKDTIVGVSLYYPGEVEVYIPSRHIVPIFDEPSVADMLKRKYIPQCDEEHRKLRQIVQELIDDPKYTASKKPPFSSSSEFNPNSVPHVKWLCYDLLKLDGGKNKGTGKEILSTFNLPVTKQILKCRSLVTLIGTFVEKLPNNTSSDSRIHCQFKSIGADTGRMSSAEPNMQNIPSRANDIRHMFRATPGYVLLSSDYSQQEPKLTAYVSQDENMIRSFKENKDIYSFIASIAFNKTYEECREFTPDLKAQT